MPTINSGFNDVLTILVGEKIRLEVSGYADITIDAVTTTLTNTVVEYGKYTAVKTLAISNVKGSVIWNRVSDIKNNDLTAVQQSLGSTPAAVGSGKIYDQAGNEIRVSGVITGLSSCSVLGDSKMYFGIPNNGIASNGQLTRPGGVGFTGGIYSNAPISWYNQRANALGVGVDVLKSYATGSYTLEQILAEQVPLVVADGTAGAWLHGGVNNFNSILANNDPVPTILATMRTILTALSAAKQWVIVDTVPPVIQTGTTSAKGRAQQFRTYNAGLKALVKEFSNVIVNDVYDAIRDTTSLDNNALARALRADDGIHYLTEGAALTGQKSYENIAPKLKLTKYKTPGANLLPAVAGTTGGTATAGSGTITNSPAAIPTNWNVQVASGSAAVTVSALAPDMTRLEITNAGGTASTIYLQVSATIQASLLAALSAGDTIQAGFTYQCKNNVLLNRIAAQITLNGDVPANRLYWFGNAYDSNLSSEPTITYPQWAEAGVISTPPLDLTGTRSKVEFLIVIQVGATTGATTIDISDAFFNKLT
jgi:hypothetical protein